MIRRRWRLAVLAALVYAIVSGVWVLGAFASAGIEKECGIGGVQPPSGVPIFSEPERFSRPRSQLVARHCGHF